MRWPAVDGPGGAGLTGGLECGQSATGWVLARARPFRLSGLALMLSLWSASAGRAGWSSDLPWSRAVSQIAGKEALGYGLVP